MGHDGRLDEIGTLDGRPPEVNCARAMTECERDQRPPGGVPEGGMVHGFVDKGFEDVASAFRRNFAEGLELGAAFAVVVDGEPVVDLWGGWADPNNDSPWEADTVCCVFSGTKGLVATCLAILIDRGLLDLDAPVAHYWPEFAANGKGDVLVRHVVSHQAGLPGLTIPVSVEEATDHVLMAEMLAAQRPIAPAGHQVCYHALTFGWLCGELVRRIDGRSVGRFFHDEVASPLGLDLWIGLPESEEPRVAVLERGPEFRVASAPSSTGIDEAIAWSIWENPPRFSGAELAANRRDWRAAEIPATNGVGTARSIARLYGCLSSGGRLGSVNLLSSAAILKARECLASGYDPFQALPVAFGIGFELQNERMILGPESDAFGHGGAGGSVHGAWPSRHTGFSYVTNRLGPSTTPDARAARLLNALYVSILAIGGAGRPNAERR